MEPFDYYVSGVKILRQIPRFKADLVTLKGPQSFDVNHALNEGPFVLIFTDQASHSIKWDLPVNAYIVVRETPENITPSQIPVISDATLTVAESFGVLNEKTGRFIPSVFGVKASGQLGFKLEGIALESLTDALIKPALESLKS
jgi:hypothetical protein